MYPTSCPVCGADWTQEDRMEIRGSRRVYQGARVLPDGTLEEDDGWSEGDIEMDPLAYCLTCDAEISIGED